MKSIYDLLEDFQQLDGYFNDNYCYGKDCSLCPQINGKCPSIILSDAIFDLISIKGYLNKITKGE